MTSIVVSVFVVFFLAGITIGIISVIAISVRREERGGFTKKFQDTPANRAVVTLREIVGRPSQNSAISRTPAGQINVRRSDHESDLL